MAGLEEEKMTIKDGWLWWLQPTMFLQRSHQRYFVFSRIESGHLSYLRLEYYDDKASYKRRDSPKGYIDILNAENITTKNGKIGNYGHLIVIKFPQNEIYLSASDCEDQFQWCIELRAYKFNDRSMLHSHHRFRSVSVSQFDVAHRERCASTASLWSCPTLWTSMEQEETLDSIAHSYQSDLKIRKMFLYCKKCASGKKNIMKNLDMGDNESLLSGYTSISSGGTDKEKSNDSIIYEEIGPNGKENSSDYDEAFCPTVPKISVCGPQEVHNQNRENATDTCLALGSGISFEYSNPSQKFDLNSRRPLPLVPDTPTEPIPPRSKASSTSSEHVSKIHKGTPYRLSYPIQDTNPHSDYAGETESGMQRKEGAQHSPGRTHRSRSSSLDIDELGYVVLESTEEPKCEPRETFISREELPQSIYINGKSSALDEKPNERYVSGQGPRETELKGKSVLVDGHVIASKSKQIDEFDNTLSDDFEDIRRHDLLMSERYVTKSDQQTSDRIRRQNEGPKKGLRMEPGTQESTIFKESLSELKIPSAAESQGNEKPSSKRQSDSKKVGVSADSTGFLQPVLRRIRGETDQVNSAVSAETEAMPRSQQETSERGSQCNLPSYCNASSDWPFLARWRKLKLSVKPVHV